MIKQASKLGLAVVLSVAMIVSGCSTSWLNTALADLPIIINIATAILSIADVAAVPQAQAAGAEAQKDLQTLQAAINDYKSAVDAASQASALVKVQAAIAAAQGHLGDILASVHIKDANKQAAIAAGIGVALSVLASVQALLPSNAPKVSRSVHLAGPKEVKRSYNSAIGGAYPSAVLH